jgi:hypothetical protein
LRLKVIISSFSGVFLIKNPSNAYAIIPSISEDNMQNNNPLLIPFIGVVGVVIGCLLTGLFSIVNSYFQAVAVKEREKNKLILEKLESLFETLGILREFYGETFKTFHRYLIGSEALPTVAPPESDEMMKVLCLQSFYAPSLKDKISQLFTEIQEFTAFKTSVLLYIASKVVDAAEVNKITKNGQAILRKINTSCLGIQEELAKLSKEYLK